MIRPASYDFVASRNADFRAQLAIRSSGVPQNLTGWSFAMKLADAPGGTIRAVATITADVNAGTLDIYIAKETLTAMPNNGLFQQLYQYDLIATESGGDDKVFLRGRFVLSEGITR